MIGTLFGCQYIEACVPEVSRSGRRHGGALLLPALDDFLDLDIKLMDLYVVYSGIFVWSLALGLMVHCPVERHRRREQEHLCVC